MIVKAKKKFGQNFLKDEAILQKIVQTIPNDNTLIVEIGSGLGDLTGHLLRFGKVISFEIDNDLKPILREKFSDELDKEKLNIIFDDVLNHWQNESLFDFKYNLIANLPYYVATNIILKALRDKNCKSITVLIQKEVALKFNAKPLDKNFSALAILAQSVADVQIICDVKPSSFMPAPKVTSSVIKMTKKENYKQLDDKFEDFLKICFCQPRKLLTKNLSAKFDKNKIAEVFDEADIKMTNRPHQITIQDYINIYKKLKD